MIIETLIALFTRDLKRLHEEIDSYRSESNIWVTKERISNSAGNLCLHLIGNLNGHIGTVLGKTGYLRNREQEFSLTHVPKAELLKKIDETIVAVSSSLRKMDPEELDQPYPLKVLETRTSTAYLLIHLTTHLSYHLGQINYHRRLLDQ